MALDGEVKRLLKNIAKGLERMDISDLNLAICKALTLTDAEAMHVDTVLRVVAYEFGMSVNSIRKKGVRGLANDAKQIAMCYLHFESKMTVREIGVQFNGVSSTSVMNAVNRYRNADPNHIEDKKFLKMYRTVKDKMTNKLHNQ